MLTFSIVEANDTQRLSVASLYDVCGYGAGISDQDIVLAALDGERVLGAARLCLEHGVLVLRGMQVLPSFQRMGIGTKLLRECEKELGDRTCFCIPRRPLEAFYRLAGFHVCEPTRAPEFLAQRCSQYMDNGMDVILMERH